MLSRRRFPRLTCAFFALALLLPRLPAAETVRVQLKWLHQFQFAGYYAAIEKGYYRDAGLDVKLLEGAPGVDPAEVVLAGRAEFGVGTPELLLNRAAGAPLVVLGVIFQHSPYIFLALEGKGIDDVAGLANRRVMIEPQAAELYAYLQRERVDRNSLRIEPHTFSAEALVDGSVDAMSAYSTDEPFALERDGRPYLAFNPRAGGVDFYGDCFFTTEREIRDHPDRVRAFREATLRGWDYALHHPGEIIELIVTKYHSRKSREALRFEAAEMRDLMHPDIIPVGYMYPGRWRHIMETYQELGMLKEPVALDGFLYDPNPRPDLTPLYWITGAAVLLALATWGVLLPIWRLNRRLKREIAERIGAEEQLRAARDVAVRASQSKMEFLGHITHDLRTPVSSILMQAELMNQRPLDDEVRAEIGVIREAGEHLLALVNELLEMQALETGRLVLADVPFRFADALDPVLHVIGVGARRKGLALERHVDPALPGLHGDPDRLRQILFNLVGNAVKFTDRGSVSLRAARTDSGQLLVEVADTGPGIPADQLAAIFDPFTRAPAPDAPPREGSGLGLAIVKRLAEAMGGRVSVRSVVGTGSTFAVTLPLLADSPAPSSLPNPAGPA